MSSEPERCDCGRELYSWQKPGDMCEFCTSNAMHRKFYPELYKGENEPHPPASGRNGRWVKLGEVGVDSASIGITDLLAGVTGSALTNVGAEDSRYAVRGSEFAGDWGTGVRFWAGFGDGGYDVWAWVVDYGKDDEADERVAQVVVTMIDADDLAHWRSLD